MEKDKALEEWLGQFGDEYTERNMPDEKNIQNRMQFFNGIFSVLPAIPVQGPPKTILEVGANVGGNLKAIDNLYHVNDSSVELHAVEPNLSARKILKTQDLKNFRLVEGHAGKIEADTASYDLVFTCGVLIHIPPAILPIALGEIYRVSRRFIVCAEYFSPEPREVEYRGHKGLLWTRDFGEMWLNSFPGLRCCGYSFAWKRFTGMDNLTWFVFEKVH